MELTSTTLNQLRAFEAVARHGSFKHAAEALFVTQSALSHHLGNLERDLGVKLIRRLHRRLELTPEGSQLLADTTTGLQVLAAALRNLKRPTEEDTLTIGVPPYFSSKWLTPRLGNLWLRHPNINLLLHHMYQPVDFLRDKLDAGITWGHGTWPEVEATLVLPTRYTPICSPSFLDSLGGKVEPEDLLHHHLFYEVERAHWQQWFLAAGIMEPGAFNAVRIDDSHALRRVALDGHGFALFFAEQIHEDVQTGQLVRPFGIDIDPGCAYYLIRPRSVPESPKLTAFTRWLLDEVATNPYA